MVWSQHYFPFRKALFSSKHTVSNVLFMYQTWYKNLKLSSRVLSEIYSIHRELLFHKLSCILSKFSSRGIKIFPLDSLHATISYHLCSYKTYFSAYQIMIAPSTPQLPHHFPLNKTFDHCIPFYKQQSRLRSLFYFFVLANQRPWIEFILLKRDTAPSSRLSKSIVWITAAAQIGASATISISRNFLKKFLEIEIVALVVSKRA